jgi:heptosyltransferase-2
MVRFLRSRRFDLAVNLKWASEGAALLAYFSAPKTAGGGKRILRRLYTYRPPIHPQGEYRHEYHKNRDIVEALGIPPALPRAYLHMQPEDHAFAEEFLASRAMAKAPVLLIAPGASRPGKMWPKEKYAEVGRRFIAELGGSVVVSWGPQDAAIAQSLVAAIGAGAHLCPRTTVRQIGAIAARCNLVLCNNSGIMHVAYAVDTPVICLNTSVSWAPYGERSIGVNAYAPEHLLRQPELGPVASARRLDQISADEVWEVLRKHGIALKQQGISSAEPSSLTRATFRHD